MPSETMEGTLTSASSLTAATAANSPGISQFGKRIPVILAIVVAYRTNDILR